MKILLFCFEFYRQPSYLYFVKDYPLKVANNNSKKIDYAGKNSQEYQSKCLETYTLLVICLFFSRGQHKNVFYPAGTFLLFGITVFSKYFRIVGTAWYA
jgi:hypothetical protein